MPETLDDPNLSDNSRNKGKSPLLILGSIPSQEKHVPDKHVRGFPTSESKAGLSENTSLISSSYILINDTESLVINPEQNNRPNTLFCYWEWTQLLILPVLIALPFILFGWREVVNAWFIPPLAIIAAVFPSGGAPIAGGIVFLPMLVRAGVQAKQAVAFSAAVQSFGCGIFAPLNWTSLSPHILIVEILCVSMIPGVLGCVVALIVFPMTSQTIEIFFAFFCIFLAFYVIYGLLHDLTTNNEEVVMTTKDYLLYSCCCFIGGLVTGWIGIGIEKVLFVLLTAHPHHANIKRACITSIAIVGWISLISLVLHLVYLNDVPLVLWCCGIPGVLIGAQLGPKINKLVGSRNIMIMFVLMLLYDSSSKLKSQFFSC